MALVYCKSGFYVINIAYELIVYITIWIIEWANKPMLEKIDLWAKNVTFLIDSKDASWSIFKGKVPFYSSLTIC